MTDYSDGKWHGWDGGECPVHPRSVVVVKLSGGSECGDHEAALVWGTDIIAFRVVKEHKEPRKFWKDDGDFFWSTYEGAKKYCTGEPVKFSEEIE